MRDLCAHKPEQHAHIPVVKAHTVLVVAHKGKARYFVFAVQFFHFPVNALFVVCAYNVVFCLRMYIRVRKIVEHDGYSHIEKFKYEFKMNADARGSFTELVHTVDCGQVSINVSKPGITKGQHWHNSKWELFIVVSGHGLIQERNINTGEIVEFEVSGNKIEAVYMIPGWTHNIINLSDTENLVTVMTCNEIFNPERPDTFFEPV